MYTNVVVVCSAPVVSSLIQICKKIFIIKEIKDNVDNNEGLKLLTFIIATVLCTQ